MMTDDSSLSVRPQTTRIIGQKRQKEQLAIALESRKSRLELGIRPLVGPPGLGKTTTRNHQSPTTFGVATRDQRASPTIQGDLTAIPDNLREKQCSFWTRIHRPTNLCSKEAVQPRSKTTNSISSSSGPSARDAHHGDPTLHTPSSSQHTPGPPEFRAAVVARARHPLASGSSTTERRTALHRDSQQGNGRNHRSGRRSRRVAMRSRGRSRIANHLLRRVRDYAQCVRTASCPCHSTKSSHHAGGLCQRLRPKLDSASADHHRKITKAVRWLEHHPWQAARHRRRCSLQRSRAPSSLQICFSNRTTTPVCRNTAGLRTSGHLICTQTILF